MTELFYHPTLLYQAGKSQHEEALAVANVAIRSLTAWQASKKLQVIVDIFVNCILNSTPVASLEWNHARIEIAFCNPVAILLTAAFSGCKTKEHQDPRTVPELVRVATVAHAQEDDRSFTGVVTARVQSDLGFRVPGKLTKAIGRGWANGPRWSAADAHRRD